MSALLDLHVHSHWSDGDRSPWELVAMAKERGLAGLALTDHDTLALAESISPLTLSR